MSTFGSHTKTSKRKLMSKHQNIYMNLTRKKYELLNQREMWSDAEHDAFVELLKVHQRDWMAMSKSPLLQGKTLGQIRSHAQKYFAREQREGRGDSLPPARPKKLSSHEYPKQAEVKRARVQTAADSRVQQQQRQSSYDFDAESMNDGASSERLASVAADAFLELQRGLADRESKSGDDESSGRSVNYDNSSSSSRNNSQSPNPEQVAEPNFPRIYATLLAELTNEVPIDLENVLNDVNQWPLIDRKAFFILLRNLVGHLDHQLELQQAVENMKIQPPICIPGSSADANCDASKE